MDLQQFCDKYKGYTPDSDEGLQKLMNALNDLLSRRTSGEGK